MRHLAALLCIVLLEAYATAPLVHLHDGGEDHDARLHAHFSGHDTDRHDDGSAWTAPPDGAQFVDVFLSPAPAPPAALSPLERVIVPAQDLQSPQLRPAPIPLAHGPPTRDPGLLRAPPA